MNRTRRFAALGFGLVALVVLAPSRSFAASALSTVAQEAARGLEGNAADALVVAAPLLSDETAPKGDELVLRVARLFAGRLGPRAVAHGKPETLAAAHAIGGGTGALVYVQVEVAKGNVRVVADVYPKTKNAWDRVRMPAPGPLKHAFASAPSDAEVRSFLSPILLEQASLHKAKHDEADVLALACGDVDGDFGLELALVSRARVALGHVRGAKLVVGKAATWPALAPRAASPLREPLASAVFAGKGRLLVAQTDRGGVWLDENLANKGALKGVPLPFGGDAACAQPSAEAGAFEGALTGCLSSSPSPVASPDAPAFDAFAAAEIVDAKGAARSLVVIREPSGRLHVRFGEQSLAADGAGAQLAIGDLDLDGLPEIVTTTDSSEDDAIVVSSLSPEGLRTRAKLPAPKGVRALAVCPPEARGVPAVAAVVGGEVWIWR